MDCCKMDTLLEVSFWYIKKKLFGKFYVPELNLANLVPGKTVSDGTFHTPNTIVEEEFDIFPKELCY